MDVVLKELHLSVDESGLSQRKIFYNKVSMIIMEREKCTNREINMENCPCTYPGCSKKGICCECIQYHLENNELPACAFPEKVEKTYDRSFKKFIEIYS